MCCYLLPKLWSRFRPGSSEQHRDINVFRTFSRGSCRIFAERSVPQIVARLLSPRLIFLPTDRDGVQVQSNAAQKAQGCLHSAPPLPPIYRRFEFQATSLLSGLPAASSSVRTRRRNAFPEEVAVAGSLTQIWMWNESRWNYLRRREWLQSGSKSFTVAGFSTFLYSKCSYYSV